MLGLLKRTLNGSEEVSKKDLSLLVRYFPVIAEKGSSGLLKRLWPLLLPGERNVSLISALKAAAENANIGALDFLFEQSFDIKNPDFLFDLFAEEGGIQEKVTSSGSIEAYEIVIGQAFQRSGNDGFIDSVLSGCGFGLRHNHMLDHALEKCAERGGKQLVEQFFSSANLALEKSVFNRPEAGAYEFALHFMQTINERLGAEAAAHALAKILTDRITCGGDLFPENFCRLLDAVDQFAGTEVIKRAFDLYHEKEDLPEPEEVNALINLNAIDQKFTALMEKKPILSYRGLAEALLNKTSPQPSADQAITSLMKSWAAENMDARKYEIDSQLRTAVIKKMIKFGRKEDLELLDKVHQSLGRPSVYNEALLFLTFAVARIEAGTPIQDRPATFQLLFDYALQNFGPAYATTLLNRDVLDDQEDGHIEEMLEYAVAENDLPMIAKIMEGLKTSGGLDLCLAFLRKDNYVLVNTPAMHGQGMTTEYLLDFLPLQDQQAWADAFFMPHWSYYLKGKIRRSDFLQTTFSGHQRWLAMTDKNPPVEALAKYSPYRFREKLFNEILPYVKTAGLAENDTDVEVNAYKLSVLFATREEIDQYLFKFARTWGRDSRKIVHDACLFELPDGELWNPKIWKKLVLRHGPDIYPLLKRAGDIETKLAGTKLPETPEEINALIAQKTYKRASENQVLAGFCHKYSKTEKQFDQLLEWIAQNRKSTDYMPDILIDGASIGHPDYYMTRLAPDDPLGFFIGEKDITDCCQKIDGNGKDVVFYGMSSPYSCFYVIKQKTEGKMTEGDRVVGQSWAWVGTDNALVLDSYERRKSAYDRLIQPFSEQFAYEIAGRYSFVDKKDEQRKEISSVHLGCAGGTPPLNMPIVARPSVPIDYKGKYPSGAEARDSLRQYSIRPVDHASQTKAVLPPATVLPETEIFARQYIQDVLRKLKTEYNIVVKTGIEVECYAIGKDGVPTSKILDIRQVNGDFAAAGLKGRFDDENTIDYCGQYEVATPVGMPFESVNMALELKSFLASKAQEYGLRNFDFSTLPVIGEEASSNHISLSLWNPNGEPLLSHPNGSLTSLLEKVVSGMLDYQKLTVLPFAEDDGDYQRFHNTEWSPCAIRAGNAGDQGLSLRVANASNMAWLITRANPADVRIENRLPSGSCNLWVAMAATLASVEYALDKYYHRLELGQEAAAEMAAPPGTERLYSKEYALPTDRYEALQDLKKAIRIGLFKGAAAEMFASLVKQHDPGDVVPAVSPNRSEHRNGSVISLSSFGGSSGSSLAA